MDNSVLKEKMQLFEKMINTADENLAQELIAPDASFYTPANTEPLYGADGYLSIVYWMRNGFSDVQWHIKDIVADNNKTAVYWELTGTHTGNFMGIKSTGKKISVCVMNFYYFNEEGKIIKDIASVGMIGILQGIGVL